MCYNKFVCELGELHTEYCKEWIMKHYIEKGNSFTNFSISEILKPSFGHSITSNYRWNELLYGNSHENLDYNAAEEEIPECALDLSLPKKNKPVLCDAASINNRDQNPIPFQTTKSEVLFYDQEKQSSGRNSPVQHEKHNRAQPPLKDSGADPVKDSGTLPAWVYCTRYSDRPAAGPRKRKSAKTLGHKKPRTSFKTHQLERLQREFDVSPYLSDQRRKQLADRLHLTEAQVKVWFQNKRAKDKKSSTPNMLTLKLMAEGLYNHRRAKAMETDSCDSDISCSSF